MFLWAGGGFFMKKWMLMLCILLFFDVQMVGGMRDNISLEVYRKAGMPVELFQKIGMKSEDMECYLNFWEDLKYFPVAGRINEPMELFYFQDTWQEERNYGGKRIHEGCDIFGEQDKREYYPVVSITDGMVETVGWLPLGGWRIGIRSPGGGFFYYAHLSSYEKQFQVGDTVNAGEILGFLGDTGYGEEGTKGKFPCHLHVGIYIQTKKASEYALNPYPVLLFLKDSQKNFFY